jgi:transcriptional regulator with XRE-family HTH domain
MTPEEDKDQRYRTIATRLAAARRASGMNQLQVAQKIGQKNMTQVSLWESGDRLPKLFDLIDMSQIYAVPLDFICGLSNDAIADAPENNQSFLANMVTQAIMNSHTSWLTTTAKSISTTINGRGQDRSDLREAGNALSDLRKAFNRFVELNPAFEEDMAGGASLTMRLNDLEKLLNAANTRIADELNQRELFDREISLADGQFSNRMYQDVQVSVNQQLLDLTE